MKPHHLSLLLPFLLASTLRAQTLPATRPYDLAAIEKGLASDDFKTRETAQQQLDAIPEEEINVLRQRVPSIADEEVRARVQTRIARMQAIMDNYFNSAAERYGKRDWAGAISDYTKGLERRQGTADIYVSRGNARDENGDPAGAIADYTKALELNPNYADAYFNRGITRLRQGDLDGCLADYDRAIQLNTSAGTYYFYRTVVKERKGDILGAAADFDRAIALQPAYADHYTFRGAFKQRQGDRDAALNDYNAALQLNPKSGWTYQYRGVLRFDQQQWNLALADFRKDAEYDPADTYAQVRIWLTQARSGSPAEAAKELAAFLDSRKEPRTDDWPTTLCQFLAGRIKEDAFLAAAEKLNNNQQLCQAYYCAANVRLINGDKTAAIDLFEKCIATNEKTDLCRAGAIEELKRLR